MTERGRGICPASRFVEGNCPVGEGGGDLRVAVGRMLVV